VLGIFAALLSDAWLAGAAGGAEHKLWLGLEAWRWMFLAAVVPALIYGTVVLGVPESPRYLVARGRLDEAKAVLHQVLGMDDELALEAKLADIGHSLRIEYRPRLADLRGKCAGLLPIVWIGIALSVFQQFVGINVIFYYSSVLWQSVGITQANSLLISFSSSVINIIGTFIAISLVDKIGRKPLLLIGSAGMAISLGTAAWAFSYARGLSLPAPQGPIALVAANV